MYGVREIIPEYASARFSCAIAACAARFPMRPGWRRQLFAAALVVSAMLIVPHASHAGLIMSWSPAQSELTEPELSSLGGLDDGMSTGSSRGVPDRAPPEKNPAEKPSRFPQARDLWTATDCSGGATNTPPSGGTYASSPGIVVGGPALKPLTLLGHVFMDQALTPLSPMPDGLLDPPKVSTPTHLEARNLTN